MTEKKTQRTPGGIEIPIPTRGEVFGALTKVARPKPKSQAGRKPSKGVSSVAREG